VPCIYSRWIKAIREVASEGIANLPDDRGAALIKQSHVGGYVGHYERTQ
jgi:hypothetical protein